MRRVEAVSEPRNLSWNRAIHKRSNSRATVTSKLPGRAVRAAFLSKQLPLGIGSWIRQNHIDDKTASYLYFQKILSCQESKSKPYSEWRKALEDRLGVRKPLFWVNHFLFGGVSWRMGEGRGAALTWCICNVMVKAHCAPIERFLTCFQIKLFIQRKQKPPRLQSI